ncbi:MAG TPA: cytochrome c oxidase subunit II [Candidatus Dormibacteraeota bacterium]|jgi:cytochrome c oxidase subunit 2|nr:cytochrome c oxidase subunit II [Candidatus Dormibacteraeota bacterium]
MTPRPKRLDWMLVGLLGAVLVLTSSCSWVGWNWDTPMSTVVPKSDFGRMTHEIFMLISWWTLGIFIVVEVGLLYVCWRFRDRPGAPIPKQVHGHTALEVSWTIAFAVILLVFAIPTIRVIFKTQEAPAATDLHVDVVGKQWWWEFRYPKYKITTANELHLPVGQTAAFFLNAPDVIHSFWMPQLGGKRDVVPHRVNHITLTPEVPGEYPGQCAEYCGMSHANMRFHVIVHTQADFDTWVKAQQAPPVESADPLAQQGKTIFTQSTCVGCHSITGISAGHIGPDLTHFASRKKFAGSLMESTPENLAKWIENPEHMKPGALMPNLGMTGDQSKALAAYLLSLK